MNKAGRFLLNWITPDRLIILFCIILLVFVWSGALWQIRHDSVNFIAFSELRVVYLTAIGVSLFILVSAGYIIARLRKQHQEASWLRTVVENTPIIFYALDAQGTFILSEGLGLKKIGLEVGEAVGRSAFKMYRDYPDIIDAIRRSTGGETVFFEHRVGEVYLNNRLVPLLDNKGQIKAVVGAAIDITERVIAERCLQENFEKMTATHEELVAAEEELRTNYNALKNERAFSAAVLESVPGLLYLYDAGGRLIRWNKNHEIATGYSAEELGKMTLVDWYKGDQETINRINGEVAKAIQEGTAFAEANLQNKDGSETPYYFTAVKMTINVTTYFVGIGIDISDRKKAEAALQKNLEELTMTHEELVATEEELRIQYDELDKINHDLISQNTVLEALREMAAKLMSETELDKLLKTIMTWATTSFGTPHGNIALLNEREMVMDGLGGLGLFAGHAGTKLNLDKGMIGQVYRTGQPIVVRDYYKWEHRLSLPTADKIFCFAQVPLKRGDKVIGVIGVAFTNNDYHFAAKELELLKRFAELASIAVENVRKIDELHRSEKMAIDIFNASGDGLVVYAGETGEILAVNHRIQKLFGYSEQYFKEQGIDLIANANNKEAALNVVRATITDGPQPLYEQESYDRAGRRLMLEVSSTPVEMEGKIRCLASMRDITVRKQMEEGMEYLRQHDPMTNVYNRAYFETNMICLRTSKHGCGGIFVCDVDGLKLINDTLGHRQGDELLKRVAMLLVAGIKPPNYVARIGGDEFAVVLLDSTTKQMEELEQYYRLQVEAYNDKHPHLPLSLSIGWAVNEKNANLESIFKIADNNMYRQKMHQSQSIRSSIVQTIMKALEVRDHITEGHADRMSMLMVMMGERLSLPQGSISDLRLFAKFHDIGKVGIPDSILKKPGKLTDDEMNIMKQHCEIGFRIAKSSRDLEPIADWVLKHQEHWNGKGYPLGISGEAIPIQCRVLSIVDAYDAMTNDRPYRKAMSHEDALAEMRRCSGTQFDPVLVEVFINMLSQEIV